MSLVRRHTIRLQKVDYSRANLFFVTICIHKHRCIFSEYSELKKIIENNIFGLDKYFLNISIEKYIIMPNHVHLLLKIKYQIKSITLGKIILVFKSKTVNDWLKTIKANKINELAVIWERNYFEHIVRNKKEKDIIERYIENNPINWQKDKYYKQ